MDHNDIRHKLSEYIDGSVPPEERAAIEEHLTTCTECSNAVTELRKTIEAVKQIEEVEAPAWMTQKIMAKVREEQEAKKNIWHRVLAFFTMKYPIQALTVLFLAVTAYYLYGSINPAQKYAGEPAGVLAKKETPPVGRMPEEGMAVREAAPEQKQAPQKPGYKSLDMKYSYEKPAAPVLQEQAKREAFTSAQDDAFREKQAAPMRAQDKAAPEVRTAAPSPAKQEAPAPAQTGADLNKRLPTPRTTAPLMSERLSPTAGASASREADAQLAVTEQFAKNDLPGHMKIKGLSFSVRKYLPDQTDLQWLPKTAAYRSRPCSDRYIVDVDLSGTLSKYLYCYDRSKAVLIGVFELRDEVWSEHK